MALDFDDFWGDRTHIPSYEELRAKASLVGARRWYVEKRFGTATVEEVASKLSEDLRDVFLIERMPMSWCPLLPIALVDEHIWRGPMQQDPSYLTDFGRELGSYDLSTMYRVLFKIGSPSFVLKNANVAFRTYFDAGKITAEEVTSNSATLRLSATTVPLYMCAHAIGGWLESALMKSGAREPAVTHSACIHRGGACTWLAKWR